MYSLFIWVKPALMFLVMFADRCFSCIVYNWCFSVYLCTASWISYLFSDYGVLTLKITLDLNIWWSVPVSFMYCSCATNVHLIPAPGDESIICLCRERRCVLDVLCVSFCLNIMLVTIRSNSVHSANIRSTLKFLIPY